MQEMWLTNPYYSTEEGEQYIPENTTSKSSTFMKVKSEPFADSCHGQLTLATLKQVDFDSGEKNFMTNFYDHSSSSIDSLCSSPCSGKESNAQRLRHSDFNQERLVSCSENRYSHISTRLVPSCYPPSESQSCSPFSWTSAQRFVTQHKFKRESFDKEYSFPFHQNNEHQDHNNMVTVKKETKNLSCIRGSNGGTGTIDLTRDTYPDSCTDKYLQEASVAAAAMVTTYPATMSTTCQRRGTLQLWQFLVSLLDDPNNSTFIAWTGRGLEFKLIEPEEVARRWGLQKNRPAMNYDKLSRSLRYYYEKGILQKVSGERMIYEE